MEPWPSADSPNGSGISKSKVMVLQSNTIHSQANTSTTPESPSSVVNPSFVVEDKAIHLICDWIKMNPSSNQLAKLFFF